MPDTERDGQSLSDIRLITDFDDNAYQCGMSMRFGHALRVLSSCSRRDLPLKEQVQEIWDAARLNQIEFLFNSKGIPVAFAVWALVTEEVAETLAQVENYRLHLSERNEGDQFWILDIVAPFNNGRTMMRKLRQRFAPPVTRVRAMRKRKAKERKRLIDLRLRRTGGSQN